MRTDLTGKVALVTGGARGIGAAIAARLAANGAALVLADIDGEGARAGAATLPRAIGCTVDIRREDEVAAAVALTSETFGRLDILVNNAGVNTLDHRVPIDRFPVAEWERIRAVDLDGLFLVTRHALAPMLAGGRGGRVVNIGSVVGLAALRLQSPFVAAKAAILHLTRSMALELGGRGVTVNAVAPGSVTTEVTRKLFYGADGTFSAQTEAFMAHIPLARPGTPEEIAEAVLFLASPEAGYVNGQLLTVDGGWTAGFMG